MIIRRTQDVEFKGPKSYLKTVWYAIHQAWRDSLQVHAWSHQSKYASAHL